MRRVISFESEPGAMVLEDDDSEAMICLQRADGKGPHLLFSYNTRGRGLAADQFLLLNTFRLNVWWEVPS